MSTTPTTPYALLNAGRVIAGPGSIENLAELVTDFGARERMDSAEAPSRLASAIAETTAVRDPASSATVSGRTIFRRCCQ